MRVGIGLGTVADPVRAARWAAREAKRSVPKPSLALAFASSNYDQAKILKTLCQEIDPSILVGGSSYAEITPAGVTKGSVAVLLADFGDAPVTIHDVSREGAAAEVGRKLGEKLRSAGGRGVLPLGLFFSSVWDALDNHENDLVRALCAAAGGAPIAGGVACGKYDLGMSHPEFSIRHQYAGPKLDADVARIAALSLPKKDYAIGFGFAHGFQPVGPVVTFTRCERDTVLEVDGVPVLDYYRRLLGEGGSRDFFELQVQRFAFSEILDGKDERSVLRLPVACDFKKGSITYFPATSLQGRRARLTQASRKGLVAAAREAAQQARRGLGGLHPALVLVVSCCTRNAVLHSLFDTEAAAIRGVFGEEAPLFGFYSGGEIAPVLSRYRDVVVAGHPLGGSFFHAGTIAITAIGTRAKPPRVRAPACAQDARKSFEERTEVLREMLAKSEAILDNSESFLANLSRKSYQDGEQLRKQTEIIHRYTPHTVWRQIGANVARGQYELSDAEFRGCFLFMDVKGFTSYSEEHDSREVVSALNAIFEPATEIIYEHSGDVDKYIGDCIFAAFKTPDEALSAGRKILLFIAELQGRGNPFTVRIGINGGRAVRANVGAQARREYTYIGDAVNVAQRLESNCTPGRLLVAEHVFRKSSVPFSATERLRVAMKGKKAPMAAVECVP